MPDPICDSPETGDLLRQARSGDPAAVGLLLARHRSYLRRMVQLRMDPRIRGRVDASDVVQEAQIEALRRLREYLAQAALPFRLWLRQIAYDRLLMFQRRDARAARRTVTREVAFPEEPSRQLAQRLLSAESSPSIHMAREELSRRISDALLQLSEDDREIVLLRNFEELSNSEAAQVLQIEPATASKRYGRALLRLRAALLADGAGEVQP
ncbi:MAG TPA: sigma-70 family RNA polymerase sigma factor [Phycisphaerae bacterium]|jgi:RNA polymerase sigma-70 factor (ECF subfamily)